MDEIDKNKGEFYKIAGTGKIPPYFDLKNIDVIDNALVGFFDFLGFKNLMHENSDLRENAAKVRFVSNMVRNIALEKTKFECEGKTSNLDIKIFQISDTFVIYAETEEPQDIIQFIWNVHHMIFYSILYKLPIRGALSKGQIYVDKEERTFMGIPFIEAYEFERNQKWAGACIAPSFEKYIKEIGFQNNLFPLLLPYDIPMKSDNPKIRNLLAINWIADLANFIAPSHVQTKFPPYGPNSPEEEKVKNIEKFLSYAVEQKNKHGCFAGPKNRNVKLDGGIIRFVLEDDEGNEI